jgi:hypothetical protein
VKLAAADVLASAAELLENPSSSSNRLPETAGRMRSAREDLEGATVTVLPARAEASVAGERSAHNVVSSLDPGFRAQELSFVVAQIATNTEFATAASRRSWIDLAPRPPAAGISGAAIGGTGACRLPFCPPVAVAA